MGWQSFLRTLESRRLSRRAGLDVAGKFFLVLDENSTPLASASFQLKTRRRKELPLEQGAAVR